VFIGYKIPSAEEIKRPETQVDASAKTAYMNK